jgi:hypothetical protein
MASVKRTVAAALVALVLGFAVSSRLALEAHKPITSPYTYNEDVFPILREHCGRCHARDGAAPMTFLNYMDESGGALAWAQAIREMLVSQAMPPYFVDPTGPAVHGAHAMSSHELDVVVTWASGGAPEGDPAKRPRTKEPQRKTWPHGQPDLVLRMPTPHEVGEKLAQETLTITIPSGVTSAKWVKAVDLLPGTPDMVREARISIVDGTVLRVWEPGEDVAETPHGTAFQLSAGAQIRLEIFYKKSWRDEQQAKTDQSSVGLYFTDRPSGGRGIEALTIDGPKNASDKPISFAHDATMPMRVLAIRPELDQPYGSLGVTAVETSGRRVLLLKLHRPRREWPRQYWLIEPVDLTAGTRIEVTADPMPASDTAPPSPAVDIACRVGLDIVRQ